MGKILVVKEVDFSKTNIGKIELPSNETESVEEQEDA